MSILFNSDGNVVWGLDGSPVISNSGVSIVSGWWNFGLIATDDSLWSSDNHVVRLNSGALPSFDVVIDRSTTDYAGLSVPSFIIQVNQWYFVATVIKGGSSPESKLWIGTPTVEPEETTTTVSQAGFGGVVNGNNFRIAGLGVSGTYMEGNVSQVTAITMLCDTTVALNSDFLFDRYIHPLYLGTFDAKSMLGLPDGTALGPSTTSRIDAVRWFPCDVVSNSQYTSFQNVKQESAAVTQATYMSTSVTGTTLFSNVEVPAARANKVITAYSDRPMATRR